MKINNRVVVLREAVGKIVSILTSRKVRVTQMGTRAFCEYKPGTNNLIRLNLPYIPDDASDDMLNAVQGFLDHEVGHILFTDGKHMKAAKDAGVMNIWNMIEDTFVERRMSEHFTGSASNLAAVGKFYILSHSDKAIKAGKPLSGLLVPAFRAWAGQRVFQDYMKDKWHLIEDTRARLEEPMTKILSGIKSTEEAVAAAIEVKRIYGVDTDQEGSMSEGTAGSGGESGQEAMPFESTKPSKSSKHDASDPSEATDPDGDEKREGATGEPPETKESKSEKAEGKKFKKAKKEKAPKEDKKPAPEPEKKAEEEKEKKKGDDGGVEPESESSPEPEEASDVGGGEGEDADDAGGEVEAPLDAGASESEDAAEGGGESAGPKGGMTGGIGEGGKPSSTPPIEDIEEAAKDGEFDQALADAITERMKKLAENTDYLVFTTDYDKIEPIAGECSDAHLKQLQDQVDHMVAPMSKDLERAVAARSASVWTPGHRSGRLHGSSLHKVKFNRDDVFRRKHVNESKDVAVELVIDLSGSMCSIGGGYGYGARGDTKLKIATFAGYALSATLDRLNIANEVIGFTTSYFPKGVYEELCRQSPTVDFARDEALRMPLIKDFKERLTATVKRRFATLQDWDGCSQNVDGECIAIAARRLVLRREKRKIMMVLSDGHPACGGDHSQQVTHLKAVTKNIAAQGIDLIGIGICDEAPRHFYKNCVILNEVSALPSEVMAQLKAMLMKAMLQNAA